MREAFVEVSILYGSETLQVMEKPAENEMK